MRMPVAVAVWKMEFSIYFCCSVYQQFCSAIYALIADGLRWMSQANEDLRLFFCRVLPDLTSFVVWLGLDSESIFIWFSHK